MTTTIITLISAAALSAPVATMAAHGADGSSSVFMALSEATSRDVVNARGTDLADVTDFIVDRGSGRIRYAVVTDGGLLGVGGRELAVPYVAFGWDESRDAFQLDVTPEVLEGYPEFDPDAWLSLDYSSLDERAVRLFDDLATWFDAEGADPNAGPFADTGTVSFAGEILGADRSSVYGTAEQITWRVQAEDGDIRTVTAGPSWFVNARAKAPLVGDTVEITAFVPNGGRSYIAKTVTNKTDNSTTIRLRDDAGYGAWRVPRATPKEAARVPAREQFLLASDITGRTVFGAKNSRNECGTIDDLVLECGSGTVATILIDPNEDAVGTSEKLSVPWSIVNLAEDHAILTVPTDRVIGSSAVGAYPGSIERTYAHFSTAAPNFLPYAGWIGTAEPMPAATGGLMGWNADGAMAAAYADGTFAKISGTVVDEVPVLVANAFGTGLLVQTELGLRRVVLGPEWFIRNQIAVPQAGAQVTLSVRETEIDGRLVTMVSKIKRAGSSLVLWRDGHPVWDAASD